MKNKINDFGKKIGGAIKDIYGFLSSGDISSLTPEERDKFIKRDVLFPCTSNREYSRRINEGNIDKFVAFWQKKQRLCIYNSPKIPKNKEDIIPEFERYLENVKTFKDKITNCKTEEDLDVFYGWLDNYVTEENGFKVWKDFCPWKDNVAIAIYTSKDILDTLKAMMERSGFPRVHERKIQNKKEKFIPPQLEKIEREGEDYRHNTHINEQIWQRHFAFRGVEFGNWMTKLDRQVSLDYCYDALMDLASVLKVAPKSLAFNGDLALAFGARGRAGASAHYEPLRRVINLTKIHGAGSTAHEWMHALDHQIGRKLGYTDLASQLVGTDKEDELPKTLVNLVKGMKFTADGEETLYYIGSKEFNLKYTAGGHQGYWTSNCEMLARAFACYVKDCYGKKSDYLIAHADCYEFKYEDERVCAIPQGEERIIINELFDRFFFEMKKKGYLEPIGKNDNNSEIVVSSELSLKKEPSGQLYMPLSMLLPRENKRKTA